MKKLLSLIAFVTLTLATFTACSKDEDELQEKNLLVGTWVYIQESSGEYVSGMTKLTFVFREDMSCTLTLQVYINDKLISNVNSEAKYSYSSSNNTLTLTNETTNERTVWSAYLQGNRLTLITTDGTTQEYIKQ